MEAYLSGFSRKKFIDPESIYPTELSRCLSRLDLTSLGVASTLGAGIYVVTGTLARDVAGPGVVLSFFIAGIATMLAALCYAEFGARIPRVGSAYTFTYVTIGELCAFIIGWTLVLEYVIASASVARAWSAYLDSAILNDVIKNYTLSTIGTLDGEVIFARYPDIFAFLIVLAIAVLLSFGMKISSLTNNVVTVINLAVILFIIVAGATFSERRNWTDDFLPYGFSGVLTAAGSAFYAFNGFDDVVIAVEEAKDPVKDVPLATVLTVGICFLAYFGVSAVLTLMWPYNKLALRGALPEVFAMRGATWAKYIIAVGALCGLSASLIGALFPLPRMLYAMASDGLIFKCFAKVHPRTEIPVIATIFSGALASILALIFDLQALVEMMSIGTLMAYAIVALCVLLLRYQPGSVGIVKGEESLLSPTDEEQGEPAKENSRLTTGNNNGPTLKSARSAAIAMFCSLVVFFFISVLLIWGGEALLAREGWAIFLACLLSILLVASIVFLVRQPQNKTPLPFKVPCVPAIPLFSIFTNIVLILKLNYLTWVRFAVWMVVGLSIYFFYGVRHSVEGKRQEDQSGYVPLQQVDEKSGQENDGGKEQPAAKSDDVDKND